MVKSVNFEYSNQVLFQIEGVKICIWMLYRSFYW